MEIILPDEIYQVINKFTKSGYKGFLVGGAVRDLLMKMPHKDWDLTTDATPEEILKIFPEGFYENTFGTVGIKTGLGSFFDAYSTNPTVTTFGILGLLVLIFSINKLIWLPLLDLSHRKMEE